MLQVNSMYTYFCQHILEKKWQIYRRKFFEISRELSCKTSVVEPVLNNITERDSRPVNTVKRSFHQGGFL